MTSPDPDFIGDAWEYFTRHMRILERCSAEWPMPDLQTQIDSLRFTFSADVNRPFELKRTFYENPASSSLNPHYSSHADPTSDAIQSQMDYPMHHATPPTTVREPRLYNMGVMAQSMPITQHSFAPFLEKDTWNPIRIMK